MKRILILSTLLLSSYAFGSSTIVKCEGLDGSQVQKVSIRMSGKRIVPFSTKKLIKVDQGQALSNFELNLADEPYEWSKSFIARNGFSILEIGSSADSEQVGVNVATGKGFYKYSDLGSGSGNSSISLKCK